MKPNEVAKCAFDTHTSKEGIKEGWREPGSSVLVGELRLSLTTVHLRGSVKVRVDAALHDPGCGRASFEQKGA